MVNKKGQGSIAGLIFLVIVFMLIYLLLMPECERCKLLGECQSSCDGVVDKETIGLKSNELLFASPGKVSSFGINESIKTFNDINLFFDPEPYTKRLATSVDISSGWFGGSDKTLSFEVDNLDNIESASLLLDVIDSRGKLIIELNGYVIFSDKINSPKFEIVELPLAYLQEKNHLKMYTDSPNLAFWSKNFYDIHDVVLKLEFNKLNSKAVKYFSLSKLEKDNLLGSSLEFFIYCEKGQDGFSVFKVFLNDKIVNNEFLECEGKEKLIALNRDNVKEGANQLVFVIDSGKFILSQAMVTNNFIRNINPSYTFDVPSSVLRDATAFYLKMNFKGPGDKIAEINLNGNFIKVDTDANSFEANLLGYINRGENSLVIIPDNNFEIDSLLVWYE